MAECPSVCEHLHLPVQSGDDEVLRRMGRQYACAAYLELVGRPARRRPRHQPHDRRHRRLLRRDRGAVRGHAGAPARGPLRPGLRGGLLAPAGHPGHAPRRRRARPPRSGAASTSSWRSRRASAASATRPGWAAGPRSSSRRPAAAHGTTPRRHDPAEGHAAAAAADRQRLVGRNREHKLVHLDGPAELVGQLVEVVVERAGPYALAGRLVGESRATPELPPLIVIAGATATGKTALAVDAGAGASRRGDRLGRLAPGLPRAGHRHGQGDAAGARGGAAPRPRPRRPRRALHGRRLPARGARRAARASRRGAGSPSSSAARASTCAAVARGLPLDETGSAIPRCAPSWRRAWRAGRPRRRSWRSCGARSRGRRTHRPAQPAARHPRPRACRPQRVGLPPRPLGYPAPVTWLGLLADPAGHRRAIEAAGRGAVRAGLLDEAAGSGSATPRTCRRSAPWATVRPSTCSRAVATW